MQVICISKKIKNKFIQMIFLILALAIVSQIFLTIKKVNPFLSLLLVAVVAGLLLRMEPKMLLLSVEKGVSSTLGGLALILCLGAIFGKILENSGAANQITSSVINSFGINYIQWGVLLTGFLIGIPLYYNAGFIILIPFVFSITRSTGLPILYIAIPMAASLSVTHCFLPPHPGPVLLVNTFNADMGKTLVYGMILAIPIVAIAGPLLGSFYKKVKLEILKENLFYESKVIWNKPGKAISFSIALLPIVLILLSVLADHFLQEGILRKIILFTGDSTIALLIGVSCAIYFFGIRTGKKMPEIMQWLNEAVGGIAMIMLIITAGGIFKQVLIDSGSGAYIALWSSSWNMHPLIFGWLITAVLRVSIGSATVAGITAAAIVLPLLKDPAVSPELMVLAVGAGSVFGSHINDTGFWMFKEFFKLSLKETFLSWTLMEIVISVLGMAGVLLLDIFI
jgi:Gnt-I system high-affinity gluconate transporter